MGAGVAFSLVLVAGAVALRNAGRPEPAPAGIAANRPAERVVSPPLVERPSSLVAGPVGAGQLVSSGEGSGPATGLSPGAIDESTTDATIDSLISVDLMRMTPEQRSAYIQRRIVRLRNHLQGQQESPARP
jgi:hypothetical protein